MTFFTPTNEGRVQKMIDTIDLLEKSANSNKATKEDAYGLLAPLVDRVQDFIADRPGELPGAPGEAEEPTDKDAYLKALTYAQCSIGKQVATALNELEVNQDAGAAIRVLNEMMEDPS